MAVAVSKGISPVNLALLLYELLTLRMPDLGPDLGLTCLEETVLAGRLGFAVKSIERLAAVQTLDALGLTCALGPVQDHFRPPYLPLFLGLRYDAIFTRNFGIMFVRFVDSEPVRVAF